jgi:glycosyltransferase involved in cell wall biosynthesis
MVASNVGGPKDLLLNNETDLLFVVGNFKQLAKKMAYLLNDENKCLEMGKMARKLKAC